MYVCVQVTPASAEALRRMNFFVNSLFMDMPLVPTTRYVKEYTCMVSGLESVRKLLAESGDSNAVELKFK